jgi:hypothetical protein
MFMYVYMAYTRICKWQDPSWTFCLLYSFIWVPFDGIYSTAEHWEKYLNPREEEGGEIYVIRRFTVRALHQIWTWSSRGGSAVGLFNSLPVIEMWDSFRVLDRNYEEKMQHESPMRYVGDNTSSKLYSKESFECLVWIKLALSRMN